MFGQVKAAMTPEGKTVNGSTARAAAGRKILPLHRSVVVRRRLELGWNDGVL